MASKTEVRVIWSHLLQLTGTSKTGMGNYRPAEDQRSPGGVYVPKPDFDAAGGPQLVRVTIADPSEAELEEYFAEARSKMEAEIAAIEAKIHRSNGNGGGRA